VSIGVGWAVTGLAYLSIAVSFWPSLTGGATYHYNEGVHYLELKQRGLAEQQFKQALRADPDLAEAHVNLAKIYDQAGWYEGAEQEAKKGVDILERTHETTVEGSTWQQSLSVAYTMLSTAKGNNAEKIGDSDPLNALVELKESLHDFKQAFDLDPTNAQFDKFKNSPFLDSFDVLADADAGALLNAMLRAKRVKARADIAQIKSGLDRYYLDNGSYPSTDQSLNALVSPPSSGTVPKDWGGPYIEKIPADPWGNTYFYQSHGSAYVLKILWSRWRQGW
jgi:type II secretion system protein G